MIQMGVAPAAAAAASRPSLVGSDVVTSSIGSMLWVCRNDRSFRSGSDTRRTRTLECGGGGSATKFRLRRLTCSIIQELEARGRGEH